VWVDRGTSFGIPLSAAPAGAGATISMRSHLSHQEFFMARRFMLVCIIGFGSIVGCGETVVQPVAVSGTVEMDGKPLAEGTLTLVAEGGTTPSTLDIVNGKFDGKATPGAKRVEIRAFKMGEPTKMGDTVIEATKINIIPSQYNTESKIKAEVGANGGITPAKFEAKSQ
jgi:hypothetical protein